MLIMFYYVIFIHKFKYLCIKIDIVLELLFSYFTLKRLFAVFFFLILLFAFAKFAAP